MCEGHYGQTDPHFRYNFARKPNFSIVQNQDIFMCVVKSRTDDAWQAVLPKLDRNTAPNKKLIKMKMNKRVLWNHTVLRFRWHEDLCLVPGGGGTVTAAESSSQSSIISSRGAEEHAEVRRQVVVVMQQPIRATNAFSMRSWAKDAASSACSPSSSSLSSLDALNPCNNIGCS
jgi:hypothetical protein